MRLLSLVSTVVIFVAVSPPARADEPVTITPPAQDAKAEAKAHADAGVRWFNLQEFAKATEEYQKAYLLDPLPAYLYSIAQTQRLAGDCTKALRSYEAYLRTKPSAEQQTKAEANIARCEQELKDHPPVKPITAPVPVVVAPLAPLPTLIAPPPPEVPIARPVATWTGDWVGHALVGGGVAVAATGLVLYLGGHATIADYNSTPSYDEVLTGRGDADAARTKQQIGVSAIAVGGGLIVAGVAHYVLHVRGSETPPLTAAVSRGEALLVVTRSF